MFLVIVFWVALFIYFNATTRIPFDTVYKIYRIQDNDVGSKSSVEVFEQNYRFNDQWDDMK